MHIAEIFRSLQGEGRLAGVESVFIRASGCNLHCRYCDTDYASRSANGREMPVEEILDAVYRCAASDPPNHLKSLDFRLSTLDSQLSTLDSRPHHAVITGGEPMLFDETVLLSRSLRQAGWHVTIETNGTRYLPVACDLMSISPKLSNSTPAAENGDGWHARHESERRASAMMERLIAEYDYQLKFVIDAPEDCREVKRYLDSMPRIDRSRVLLMPQGTDRILLADKAHWLEPYCRNHGLTFCPRKQIEWFGPGRGM
jgi:7-carboxy-7-deazaguanine synthase